MNAKIAPLRPIEEAINDLSVYSSGAEEITAFLRILRSLLGFNAAERPRAVEVLRDPIFECI